MFVTFHETNLSGMERQRVSLYAKGVEFEYDITQDDAHVNVSTHGFFDYLKAHEMWKDVVATCNKSGCYRVLGISQLTEPMPMSDAYELPGLIESAGVTPEFQIAWVSKIPQVVERLRLVETILRDRSLLNVSVFESKSDATRWLNSRD